MNPRLKRILPVVLVLLILGSSYYLWSTGRLPFSTGNPTASDSTVSGFIEGDQYKVASEIAGRVSAVNADEGDAVKQGELLIELDHTLLDAQIAQGQAAVTTAQAQLQLVENSARSGDIAAAQAAVSAAQANYDKLSAGANADDLKAAQAALQAAQQNYTKLQAGPTSSDLAAAQAAVNSAQQNYARVRQGPTADQLGQLKAQIDNAQAAVTQAQAAYDKIGGSSNPNIALSAQSKQLQQATNNYTAALAAYNDAQSHPTTADLAAAQSQVDTARAALARLTPDAAQLAAGQAQVQQAQAAVQRLTPDSAALAAAQAQLDQAKAALQRLTPSNETLAVAQAQLKQAQTALDVLNVQLAKTKIYAPSNGIVIQRGVNVGEIAAPGNALLTLTQLDPVKLTIYVPETQLGDIQLGNQVGVQVDAFPDKTFVGKVIQISDQAEFTPRNVQSKAERVNTVFAVKLEIPNANEELKPGMPADALIQ